MNFMNDAIRSHFSRITLRREDAAVKPLLQTLLPASEEESMSIQHRLLWTLFAQEHSQTPHNESPFLWREIDGQGRFFVLGPEPARQSPYFNVESRRFDVSLGSGQKLAFELRVNATVNRMVKPEAGRHGRKRCDIVMDALFADKTARAENRQCVAEEALRDWLTRQGVENGFTLDAFHLDSYRTVTLPKVSGPRARKPQIGISDLEGVLTVRDPQAFRKRLTRGFGRLKAFGCGLMLVRPASHGFNG